VLGEAGTEVWREPGMAGHGTAWRVKARSGEANQCEASTAARSGALTRGQARLGDAWLGPATQGEASTPAGCAVAGLGTAGSGMVWSCEAWCGFPRQALGLGLVARGVTSSGNAGLGSAVQGEASTRAWCCSVGHRSDRWGIAGQGTARQRCARRALWRGYVPLGQAGRVPARYRKASTMAWPGSRSGSASPGVVWSGPVRLRSASRALGLGGFA
jgi:hypothetical protein